MSDKSDRENGSSAAKANGGLSHCEIALAGYVERLTAGEPISVDAIRREHPDLAEELIEQLRLFEGVFEDSPVSNPLGILGDYTLRRQIGRGGMGVVYEAWQGSLDRQVALKVLPAGIAADDKTFHRFMREAKTTAKLSHANIVGVHGVGIEQSTPYYAMEFVKGETLAQIIGKVQEADPEAETVFGHKDSAEYFETLAEAFAEVADGLQHAHSKGVIHRDIKPSNLILDAESDSGGNRTPGRSRGLAPRLRILDFGLARLEGQESLTLTGDVIGTPLYMSPEQARRRTIPIDHRTDVYSLGATMYEMLTGRPPFRGKNHADTLSQIIERDPVEPKKLNPRVPKDLETIVLKCLRKEAGNRYGTAEALSQDLYRSARGDPIEARRQSSWDRLSRRLRAHRGQLIVAASVVLVVFVGAVAAGLVLNAERHARFERTNRAVHAAMAEARERIGEARSAGTGDFTKWEAAIGAARKAWELATLGDAGDELEAQAAQLVDDIEESSTRQKEQAAAMARDAMVLERFERIREGRGEQIANHTEQAHYASAFRDYGIDIEALEADEAVRRIRASRVTEALCAALDDWAYLRRDLKEQSRELLEIARAADTDPYRKSIRGAIIDGDLERLEEFSNAVEGGELDAMAVPLLVRSLDMLGRDREAVVSLLRRAQDRNPDNFWITYNLAGRLQRLSPEDSESFLRAALALRPESAGVRDRLGSVLEKIGDLDGAVRVWREVLRVQPDFLHVYVHLVPALEKKGMSVTEIDTVREALDLEPGDAGAWLAVGMAFQRRRKWSEAVEAYREAAELRESGAIYHYLGRGLYRKALCASCLGEESQETVLEEAVAACEKGLDAYEKEGAWSFGRSEVWVIIGAAKRALGDRTGSVEAYEESLRLHPYCREAYYRLPDVLLETGRLADALSWYERGRRRGHSLGHFPNLYAHALRRKGRYDEAIAFCIGELPRLRRLTKRRPGDVRYRLWLGALLADQFQDFDGAAEEFRKAVQLQPKNPTAHHYLGVALGNNGDRAGAIEAYQRYLELKRPERSAWRVRGNLGDQFARMGDLEKAVLHYREALRFGETAGIHRNLGFALLGKGDIEKGLEHLERYREIEKWPDDSFYPADRWEEDSKALARLAARRSSILRGDTVLVDPRERLFFAWLCHETGHYVRAARLFLDAFAADARLCDEPFPSTLTCRFRVIAGFAAAQAGAGHGKEAETLDEVARVRWRRQAIAWLREDLDLCKKELEGATTRQRERVRDALRDLKIHNAGASLFRGEGNLSKLPEDEREGCRAFWKELDQVLAGAKVDAGRGLVSEHDEATTGSGGPP